MTDFERIAELESKVVQLRALLAEAFPLVEACDVVDEGEGWDVAWTKRQTLIARIDGEVCDGGDGDEGT